MKLSDLVPSERVFKGLALTTMMMWLGCLSVVTYKVSHRIDTIVVPPAPEPIPVPVVLKDIAIVGESQVDAGMPLDLTVDTNGTSVQWRVDCNSKAWIRQTSVDGKTAVLCSPVEGQVQVSAYTAIDNKPAVDSKLITVGKPLPPQPVPPQPVPPGPTPVPPQPVPGGFRAALVYETLPTGGPKVTKEQYAALFSPKVGDYLDRKCADGNGGWKRWDKDVDVSKSPKAWQDLWTGVKGQLPALPALVTFVSDGKGSTKAEWFPVTDEATLLATLERFGGK